MRIRARTLAGWLLLLAVMGLRDAAVTAAPADTQNLKKLSIEELMQIDVMLASRQAEPLMDADAAVSVVTADDIRRSGVTTIADALALAEGVAVARFNNGSWNVTTRGFNAAANKLLVMVDRRTEFSPLFAGVFWNMLDYTLEDIERIEIIRGPAATLWGANAVNGVINIITRHSRDTHGLYASLGGGAEDPGLADVRWGGGTAAGVNYRVYGKYAARDAQLFANGQSAGDPRRRGQIGFRADGGGADGNGWMLKGDAFQSSDAFFGRPDGEFGERALQAHWSFVPSKTSRIDLRSYYRHEYRRIPLQLTHRLDTYDVDVQATETWRTRHQLVWGGGARLNHDRTFGSAVVSFDPASRTYSVSSLFAQDEIAVKPNLLHVTAGLKVEYNTFSGAELQPNLRGRVELPHRQILWAAVSHATRRPTRIDVDIRAFTPTGLLTVMGGGDAYTSEKLAAGEAGYRAQLFTKVSLDATVFTHRYDDLRSQELLPTGLPIVVANTLNGRSSGVELGTVVQVARGWRATANYTLLDVSVTRDANSHDISGGSSETDDPRHQFMLRNAFDLPHAVEIDAWLRTVSALPNPHVPGYAELNLRAGWRPTPQIEIALVGQDLLHDHHAEFGADLPTREEFQRSIRALLTIRR